MERDVLEVECYPDDLTFLIPVKRQIGLELLRQYSLPIDTLVVLKANMLAEEGLIYLFYNSQFCACIDVTSVNPKMPKRQDRTKDQ